jgi:hypothetical protein
MLCDLTYFRAHASWTAPLVNNSLQQQQQQQQNKNKKTKKTINNETEGLAYRVMHRMVHTACVGKVVKLRNTKISRMTEKGLLK